MKTQQELVYGEQHRHCYIKSMVKMMWHKLLLWCPTPYYTGYITCGLGGGLQGLCLMHLGPIKLILLLLFTNLRPHLACSLQCYQTDCLILEYVRHVLFAYRD